MAYQELLAQGPVGHAQVKQGLLIGDVHNYLQFGEGPSNHLGLHDHGSILIPKLRPTEPAL